MMKVEELSIEILKLLREKPIFFYDVLKTFRSEDYQKILLAWGRLRSIGKLAREEATGKYKPKDE